MEGPQAKQPPQYLAPAKALPGDMKEEEWLHSQWDCPAPSPASGDGQRGQSQRGREDGPTLWWDLQWGRCK